jgi:hypothetical protein
MNDCKDCMNFKIIGVLERCDMPGLPKMEDGYGPSLAFVRADHGVHGWKHCGPEGKYWEGK